ncbi:hypothetical protein PTH_0600 [Pelotomaculum thermopropionicum SI]|uniref:Electron transfer flavoprotein alpha/beta-subunit N-terminal domain-containing protein n=1 Tax=Pelotomaculum thermopropionicum (strain DSM 13744 / JCM 10971 / SI) TaxID=370438 RepID=A5D4N4_PELTS|nr:hypothetical protein PTH_0600 [Pelotomaculum thermopropionicum SI]
MKIVVLLRNVVDCRAPLPADVYGERPLPEGMETIINPPDWYALEYSLSLCAQGICSEVAALSLGGKEAEESLRWCLAAGVRRAVRVWDEALAGADVLGKGRALAAAAAALKPDLIVCGEGCLDQIDTMLPGAVAAAAGMTSVAGIVALEKVEGGRAFAVRRSGRGRRERVAIRLPALVALEEGECPGRTAGLPELLAALAVPVPCLDLASLGLSAAKCGAAGAKVHNLLVRFPVPPVSRPFTPDSRLPAERRLREILAGGMSGGRGEVITGAPERLAEKIYRFLNSIPVNLP